MQCLPGAKHSHTTIKSHYFKWDTYVPGNLQEPHPIPLLEAREKEEKIYLGIPAKDSSSG